MVCSGCAFCAKRQSSHQPYRPDYNWETTSEVWQNYHTSRNPRDLSAREMNSLAVLSIHSMNEAVAIFEAVQSQSNWLATTLRDLVLIESPSDNKPAVDEAVRLVASLAKSIGGRVKFTARSASATSSNFASAPRAAPASPSCCSAIWTPSGPSARCAPCPGASATGDISAPASSI